MIRVGVIGASGRMGQTVIAAVRAAEDLELSCVVDPQVAQLDLDGVVGVESFAELGRGAAEVLVDFTVASVAREVLLDAARAGYHVVSGTTGLGEQDLSAIQAACEETGVSGLVAANFALGAVLAMRFAEMAAPYYDGVEVIELHHDRKIDAPSGTSMVTAQRIAAARAAAGRGDCHDPTETTVLDGARGAAGAGGVRIHSVRLPGLVAHEEILLAGPGEALTIRHDSWDRTSFMAGVLLAVRTAPTRSGLTRGLEPLLGD